MRKSPPMRSSPPPQPRWSPRLSPAYIPPPPKVVPYVRSPEPEPSPQQQQQLDEETNAIASARQPDEETSSSRDDENKSSRDEEKDSNSRESENDSNNRN